MWSHFARLAEMEQPHIELFLIRKMYNIGSLTHIEDGSKY